MRSAVPAGLNPEYTFAPLANLIYSRDQQITTAKGIVMGRLRLSQRQREVAIMRLCFLKLGMPVVGEIAAPGYLEGGDFFPAGPELCLIGVGLRSNMEACQQLMERDLLGTRCVAVVRDDFEKHQDRMHLDCVFSILSDDCCIMLEDMMGETSPTRRLVDEYVRDPISGKYTVSGAERMGCRTTSGWRLCQGGAGAMEVMHGLMTRQWRRGVPVSREDTADALIVSLLSFLLRLSWPGRTWSSAATSAPKALTSSPSAAPTSSSTAATSSTSGRARSCPCTRRQRGR